MDKIKTKLKFIKSDRTESWVGFVSINTKTGYIKGVREDAKGPKKVCIVTHELEPIIEPNVLYDVQMVPMKNEKELPAFRPAFPVDYHHPHRHCVGAVGDLRLCDQPDLRLPFGSEGGGGPFAGDPLLFRRPASVRRTGSGDHVGLCGQAGTQ